MIIERIFNNNVVLALDDGRELVAIGRGVAFGAHRGDPVDDSRVEKTFQLVGEGASERLERLAAKIDPEYLVIAEDIVEAIGRESNLELSDTLVLELADHISLSLERERRGNSLPNPLLSEIRMFYKKEYELAGIAAQVIHDHLGIWVGEDERGFIALHIVNATVSQGASQLIASIEMVRDIVSIVNEGCGGALDLSSLAFERFVRHLQFFTHRVMDGNTAQDAGVPVLITREAYPEAWSSADKIADYVRSTRGVEVNDAEKSYLVYHLATLFSSFARGGEGQ